MRGFCQECGLIYEWTLGLPLSRAACPVPTHSRLMRVVRHPGAPPRITVTGLAPRYVPPEPAEVKP